MFASRFLEMWRCEAISLPDDCYRVHILGIFFPQSICSLFCLICCDANSD